MKPDKQTKEKYNILLQEWERGTIDFSEVLDLLLKSLNHRENDGKMTAKQKK